MKSHSPADFTGRDADSDKGENECGKCIGQHFIFFNLKFNDI